MTSYTLTPQEIEVLIAENQRLRQENDTLRYSLIKQNSPKANIFKLALTKVNGAVCMTTIEGDVIFTNQEFRDEYGIKTPDYNGKIYDLPLSVRGREEFVQKLIEVRECGGSQVFIDKYISPIDNKRHFHQVSTFIMDTDEGEVIAIFMQDITDFVKSRDELRELNVLMDVILDNLPVYLFVKDVDDGFRYVYWNKAFANYSKIPASKVIGNTDFEVFPVYEDAKRFREDDIELVENQLPINRHETYEAADGTTHIVQTLKVLCHREGKGPLLIGVSWDITNMQDIEQELVRERLRAEQSDRLKSTFLANMSHEIRTPLNAIVGFSNLLTQVDDEESKAEFAEIINQNSESLLQIINDILDISKIEAGTLEYNREPMDLGELFEKIYMSQTRRMHQDVGLVYDPDPKYSHITLNEDRNRLAQVINNLINNAAKFTKKGVIRVGYRVLDSKIEVFVHDSGIGIPPEKLAHVFDRFVKLDAFARGAGLGLSICKLIVDLFGGEIWVESVYGEGSTFRFTIPYEKDKINTPIIPKERRTLVKTNAIADKSQQEKLDKTILVAEDNASNFLLLKTLLGKRFNLVWAKTGVEAVEMFRDKNPDLIFMDLKMPRLDGFEAARLIRAHSADVPIIALTAYAFQADRRKAEEAGMNDYLTKPVSINSLDDIIAKYLS